MQDFRRKHLIGDLTLKRLGTSIVSMYVLFAGALWCLADRMLFLPGPASYADGPLTMKLADTGLTAAFLPNPPAPLTILYSHGNAEDLGDVMPTLIRLHALGFAVMGYDYPGYGTSSGTPGEASVTAAALAAYTYLTETQHIDPSRIVAFGRSVGGGPTLALAAVKPVAGLILESTFTSVQAVKFPIPILPFDLFRSRETLSTLSLPTLVIHGREDALIPFPHGEALYAAAKGPKTALWVDHAGHNDVQDVAGEQWSAAITTFLAPLAKRGPKACQGTAGGTTARSRFSSSM